MNKVCCKKKEMKGAQVKQICAVISCTWLLAGCDSSLLAFRLS